MIYAQPSMTGTKPDRFIKVCNDLTRATSILRVAYRTLAEEITESPSYGHLPPCQAARQAAYAHDILHLEHLCNQLPAIDKMVTDLQRAIERAQALAEFDDT